VHLLFSTVYLKKCATPLYLKSKLQ